MRVDSANAINTSFESRRREQSHQVQDVFSEVLAAVGRQGYQSAEAIDEQSPLVDQVSESWSNWFDVELGGRYASVQDSVQLKQPYGDIMVRAYQGGGYSDPKTFLSGLSSEELGVVQKVNALAEPIRVDSLTDEGALNLLIPPPAQVDVNHDGLTQAGVGYGIRFPDSSTPADVVVAWEETTEGMSSWDRAHRELQMVMPVLLANFVLDDNGAYSHHYEPGDPEWTNPMAADDYSYVGVTQTHLDSLDYFRSQMDPLKYEEGVQFWSKFKERLIAGSQG